MELVKTSPGGGPATGNAAILPMLVEQAGGAARFAWDEFFDAEHHNSHTQKAYQQAVRWFLSWAEGQGVELAAITPGMVGLVGGSPAKRNQHLVALRGIFDRLVNRYACILNPASSAKGVKEQVIDGKTPEIGCRSTVRGTKQLTGNALTTKDICKLVKWLLKDAGLPSRLSPQSFRVTTITDLLTQGIPLEDVQYLAGHAEPRTTGLYDRRKKQVTWNIVERISI
jgi:Phage integrase family